MGGLAETARAEPAGPQPGNQRAPILGERIARPAITGFDLVEGMLEDAASGGSVDAPNARPMAGQQANRLGGLIGAPVGDAGLIESETPFQRETRRGSPGVQWPEVPWVGRLAGRRSAVSPVSATEVSPANRSEPRSRSGNRPAAPTAQGGATAIVGLPKLRAAGIDRLVVEPSVQVTSASRPHADNNTDGSSQPSSIRRPLFLSRSPEEMAAISQQGIVENVRTTTADSSANSRDTRFQPARFRAGGGEGFSDAAAASPTRLGRLIAAETVQSPSDQPAFGSGIEELPPPPPQSIEDVPGFQLGPGERLVRPGEELSPHPSASPWEADPESQAWLHGQAVGEATGRSVLDGESRRWRLGRRDGFAGDGDRPIRRWLFPEGSLSERLADRLAGRLQTSFDRVASTRQRVDAGLGALLVEHAPLVLDTTQPRKQYRFRGDFATGIRFPDRSEYYWAGPLRGPGYQGTINTQEFAFMFEVGSGATSVQTEFPVRGYGAGFGDSNASFGDIRITQKLRMLDGDRWQITQMLRVHTPTGNTAIGGGTGHVAMEPGFLFRFQRNCWTYYHAELKYRTPIGADPLFSSDVLTYGFGVSSVWYETLTAAVIPTFEVQSVNFFGGQKSGPLGPLNVDGESSITFYPGTRFVWDPGGDLGIIELGVAAGMSFSPDRIADTALRIELRFGP